MAKAYAVVSFGRVLAVFAQRQDALQVCEAVSRLFKLPCDVADDVIELETPSSVWKKGASRQLTELLTLLDSLDEGKQGRRATD